MLCERCKKRPATVHITKVVGDQKVELHLCEECARELRELGELPPPFPEEFKPFVEGLQPFSSTFFPLPELLQSFFGSFGGKEGSPRERDDDLRCPKCGMTWREFREKGKFGCSECYEAFRPRLAPLFRRIHGASEHRGKSPARDPSSHLKKRLEELRAELRRKVEEEAYEEAARIRDEIRALENELGGRAG
ncbi:UvrB/UvrC motif-containing protein [Brockia lithotrophica]|uniref:Protein arginine kinase activator n=1 Tax=Brockia lithotrophica TaxID=933949 RepID=A0A660KW23_9BACL|nr:UvrB/UvrC motif-containing protein [Brockia lithotrophica]RKQ85606.1 protein arginine kinase activator [Brockia lithotrophica]